jgi:hypothetical protein
MSKLRNASVLALLACACAAPRSDSSTASSASSAIPASTTGQTAESDPLAPKPWTTAFDKTSVLLANDVRVEGPQGLLDHIYCVASERYVVSQRTLPEGYEQTMVARPGSEERVRASLDGLRIEAIRRLVVLERVEPCDVHVTALGEVWWRDVNGAEERGDTWERTGAIER